MLQLLKKRVDPSELLESRLYNEQSFYGALTKDIKKAQRSVIIESPFLTEKRVAQFVKLFRKLKKRGVRVRVNSRIPYHHDNKTLEVQAWKAAKLLRSYGVKVYFYKDMRHRKLVMIDGIILWDGSLNVLSQSHSKEVMRRTVSVQLCQQMLNFTGAGRWHW